MSGASPFDIDPDACSVLDGTSEVLSAKLSIHFGSRRTSSGIGSSPSGRGYFSRRVWRRLVDQGRKEPSMLGKC